LGVSLQEQGVVGRRSKLNVRFQPERIVELLAGHRVTFFGGGPPAIYAGVLAASNLASADLSALRVCPAGGTVFQLTPSGALNVLYSFTGVSGGAGVIADMAGNLYGTTYGGGAAGQGTVFQLSRGSCDCPAWLRCRRRPRVGRSSHKRSPGGAPCGASPWRESTKIREALEESHTSDCGN
jgi:uncharacterized repeat protein (TIGR03803 family)